MDELRWWKIKECELDLLWVWMGLFLLYPCLWIILEWVKTHFYAHMPFLLLYNSYSIWEYLDFIIFFHLHFEFEHLFFWYFHRYKLQRTQDVIILGGGGGGCQPFPYILLFVQLSEESLIQIVPKTLQSAFVYQLWKNPEWNLKNQTRLRNYDYFSTI